MFDFDLADRVDDLICIFDNGNPDSDMDTISILLTGWITFLFCSILLVKFIYRKYKGRSAPTLHVPSVSIPPEKFVPETTDKKKYAIDEAFNASNNPIIKNGTSSRPITPILPPVPTFESPAPEVVLCRNAPPPLQDLVINSIENPHYAPISSNHKIVKKKLETPPPLRLCIGPDPDVVQFVTSCQIWMYENEYRKQLILDRVNELFLQSINEQFDRLSSTEDSFLDAVVDEIWLSEELTLDNLYAEFENSATIKVTSDCETRLNGRLRISQLSPTTGKEEFRNYEFAINRLLGRLKILIDVDQSEAEIKLDGWPEICLTVSPTSKQDARLNPKISEIVTTRLSTVIRNASIELQLEEFDRFPLVPKQSIRKKPKPVNSFLRVELRAGVDIGLHRDCDQAYCVIELDDPTLKFQSRTKTLPNPEWNETYVMNVGDSIDCELLFEVYSKIGATFLGSHIMSVDQIQEGKIQFLKLKSRRAKVTESITGTLEVLFKFVDENEAIRISNLNSTSDFNQIEDPRTVIESNFINVAAWASAATPPTPPKRPPRHSTKLEDQYGEERGRRRTRRGDIFTSLHRRFSQERSKSVATNDGVVGKDSDIDLRPNPDFARSVSADRPIHRTVVGLGLDSTRSSASELSQYSATTFTHESSTLLIETFENGIKKYYLVPPEQVSNGRWKHKKKLHIFNDHTFVAKRIQSGLSCTVCFGRFPFSLRKQGYQCRDCRLISHKECHIRVPTFCIKSTIYDIDVLSVSP